MTRRALLIVAAAATVVIAAGVLFEGPLASVLGFGVASRLIFGWVFSRIGGLRTLLLGSVMQACGFR